MLCREQFLKCPPPEYIAQSQLLDIDSKANDDGSRKVRRRNKVKKQTALDDSCNWVTEDEKTPNEAPTRRRRRLKKHDMKKEHMRNIFEAQTDEVKQVIINLHKQKIKQKKENQLAQPKPLNLKRKTKKNYVIKKHKQNKKRVSKLVPNVGAIQFNSKLLARLQRKRRNRGKPRSSKNKRKKFPRRRRRANAKKGNSQGRKRCGRAQKLFNNGFFMVGHKLLDEVWEAVKDPNRNAASFCNNNFHSLSKAHLKQIALYEKIEKDLNRLNAAREERIEAARERKAKGEQKETQRKGFKNKIELRAAARAERELLRKERRAVRKQRALEKRIRKEQAKAEMIRCIE